METKPGFPNSSPRLDSKGIRVTVSWTYDSVVLRTSILLEALSVLSLSALSSLSNASSAILLSISTMNQRFSIPQRMIE